MSNSSPAPISTTWMQKHKILAGSGLLLFISMALAIILTTLQALKSQQDLRQQAATDAGLVVVTQSAVSTTPIVGSPASIKLAVNTNSVQTDGVQLSFELITETTGQVTLADVAGSGLALAGSQIEQTANGFFIQLISLPTSLGSAFSSSAPVDFVEIQFTPTQPGPVNLVFDADQSFSTVNDSNPPQDELKTVASISLAVENPPSPTPTPSPSPTPTPTPTPTPSPSPSPSPSPASCNSICSTNFECESVGPDIACYEGHCRLITSPQTLNCQTPISLQGEDRPTGLTYIPLVVNDPPYAVTLDATKTAIEDGYGVGFTFQATAGDKLETFAPETTTGIGSYIRSVLYGPDGKKLYSLDTRVEFTAPTTGTYYLIVRTFGNKTGDSNVRVFDRDLTSIFPFIEILKSDGSTEQIDLFEQDPNLFNRVGRYPSRLILQFPNILTISGNTIRFQTTNEATGALNSPKDTSLRLAMRCQPFRSTGEASWYFAQGNSSPAYPYHLKQLDNKRVAFSPSTTVDYFQAGRQFLGHLGEDISWEVNYNSIFATGSETGVTSDINGDNLVNLIDYSLLVNEFFADRPYYYADFDCDNQVNLIDYTMLVQELSPLVN